MTPRKADVVTVRISPRSFAFLGLTDPARHPEIRRDNGERQTLTGPRSALVALALELTEFADGPDPRESMKDHMWEQVIGLRRQGVFAPETGG